LGARHADTVDQKSARLAKSATSHGSISVKYETIAIATDSAFGRLRTVQAWFSPDKGSPTPSVLIVKSRGRSWSGVCECGTIAGASTVWRWPLSAKWCLARTLILRVCDPRYGPLKQCGTLLQLVRVVATYGGCLIVRAFNLTWILVRKRTWMSAVLFIGTACGG